jgi:uncharacterized protein YbcC (UPF0753/DUF2309 family)
LLASFSPAKKRDIVQSVVKELIFCGPTEEKTRLEHLIEHAAQLLPTQGPITAFVTHNTLHAFEDLPFEEAVIKGAEMFGCRPYLLEERYRHKLACGRICKEDIEWALIDDLGDRADELLGFLGTRFHLRMAMLAHPLPTGPLAELRWVIAESDALRTFREETPRPIRDRIIADTRHWVMRDLSNDTLHAAGDRQVREMLNLVFARFDKPHLEQWSDRTWETFTLHLLWLICKDGVQRDGVERIEQPSKAIRHRDLLLQTTGQDSDRLVHDILIPFCAAFLDQGFAGWSLPNREAGFYESFLELYGQSFAGFDNGGRALRRELQRLRRKQIGPLDSITESLDFLGVASEQHAEFITATLLALRGYAGMIWQLESRADRAVRSMPAGSLEQFLAVYLILDRISLAHVAKETMAYRGSLQKLKAAVAKRFPLPASDHVEQRAFLIFQLAQLIGWKPESLVRLSSAEWALLVKEVNAFSSLQRRRIYQLAFERQYRIQALDAVAVHCRRAAAKQAESAERISPFQIICCLDDREESFRRHLEEIEPDCETFGFAGFFAVAMYYRGAADAHFSPQCPVVIKPDHYVGEEVLYTFEKTEQLRRKRRRTFGTVTHRVHIGSRTFAGGWLTAVFGSLASIPLVMRILFPRLTANLRELCGGFMRTPAATQLQLERSEEKPGPEPGHVGYSINEMAGIVERLLRDISLTKTLSRLVIVCGHGSTSMNNPHKAAYDCGACGGGRGGPNARAFAQMANDPRVREIVARKGLEIPRDTVFVGGFHNTCDDSMTYYDLDRLPATHMEDFKRANVAIDDARQRDAHERCRRFESAELNLTTEAALRHVEGRSEDLSQVRPECGHATNALCFVGRRQWSKGLFLDRRAFLQSYDPNQDDEQGSILTRILQTIIPVCAGINLEYYFSFIDSTGYGCGSKLPHNITSLIGVMSGAASDLRPGLPWQMVEIHEPFRLLFVIEATPQLMSRIIEHDENIARLVRNNWVQLATLDPITSDMHWYREGEFVFYRTSTEELPEVDSSIAWYRGRRDHLRFAGIKTSSRAACE